MILLASESVLASGGAQQQTMASNGTAFIFNKNGQINLWESFLPFAVLRNDMDF